MFSADPLGRPVESLMHLDGGGSGPVCAHFVQRGHCRLGKDCAFRHSQPGPGDRLREPSNTGTHRETWGVDRKDMMGKVRPH